MSALSALSRLQQLELGYCGVSDEGLGALQVSGSMSGMVRSVVFFSFSSSFFSFSSFFLRARGPAGRSTSAEVLMRCSSSSFAAVIAACMLGRHGCLACKDHSLSTECKWWGGET